MEQCKECNRKLKVSEDREECLDMCDLCYTSLVNRTERLYTDHDYRMAVVRANTFMAGNSNSEEVRLRTFFDCVCPEVPSHNVSKILEYMGKLDSQTRGNRSVPIPKKGEIKKLLTGVKIT